jgi:hypothetical protein
VLDDVAVSYNWSNIEIPEVLRTAVGVVADETSTLYVACRVACRRLHCQALSSQVSAMPSSATIEAEQSMY